jgi:hypothetical protein
VWLNTLLNFDSTRIEYTDFKTLKITNDYKILEFTNSKLKGVLSKFFLTIDPRFYLTIKNNGNPP